jgi:hypothetical protein
MALPASGGRIIGFCAYFSGSARVLGVNLQCRLQYQPVAVVNRKFGEKVVSMVAHSHTSFSGLRRDFDPANRMSGLSFRDEADSSNAQAAACPGGMISAGTSREAAVIQFSRMVFKGVFGAVSALPGLRRAWHRLGDWLLD